MRHILFRAPAGKIQLYPLLVVVRSVQSGPKLPTVSCLGLQVAEEVSDEAVVIVVHRP